MLCDGQRDHRVERCERGHLDVVCYVLCALWPVRCLNFAAAGPSPWCRGGPGWCRNAPSILTTCYVVHDGGFCAQKHQLFWLSQWGEEAVVWTFSVCRSWPVAIAVRWRRLECHWPAFVRKSLVALRYLLLILPSRRPFLKWGYVDACRLQCWWRHVLQRICRSYDPHLGGSLHHILSHRFPCLSCFWLWNLGQLGPNPGTRWDNPSAKVAAHAREKLQHAPELHQIFLSLKLPWQHSQTRWKAWFTTNFFPAWGEESGRALWMAKCESSGPPEVKQPAHAVKLSSPLKQDVWCVLEAWRMTHDAWEVCRWDILVARTNLLVVWTSSGLDCAVQGKN